MRDELNVLLEAIQEAGQVILQLQQTNFSISKKANGDLVTQADWLANDILYSRLSTAFPRYGWLSEESVDHLDRLNCERVWVVDPIDGTKEYANGFPEYAISVALVEQSEPVLAAVFNPAHNELFYAIKNKGAYLGENKIQCLPFSQNNLVFLASRSEYLRGEWQRYHRERHQVQIVGSIAYKMALVAAGRANATWSLGPKNEWDIAAGTLLVQEAGGRVTTKSQQSLLFNQQNVKVDGVLASGRCSYEYVCELIS